MRLRHPVYDVCVCACFAHIKRCACARVHGMDDTMSAQLWSQVLSKNEETHAGDGGEEKREEREHVRARAREIEKEVTVKCERVKERARERTRARARERERERERGQSKREKERETFEGRPC